MNTTIRWARLPYLVWMVLLVIFIGGCVPSNSKNSTTDEANQTDTAETTPNDSTPSEEEQQTEDLFVTIRSLGDILIHDTVYWNAATEEGYDFGFMFDPVRDYIGNADITTANLETLAAGNELGVSSYPLFNAPEEIIDELSELGVDIVNTASNHTMDFGAYGAYASIEALKERDMMYVGSYESWEDYNDLRIIEANGIKVGFLSYTYGTNGNPIPEDQTHLVTLLDTDLMELEIELLNSQADVSIVMIHNGEDVPYPTENQIAVMEIAHEAGANFVLGGHPHNMQPFEFYNDSQAGIYSHGNFLSGQYQLEEKLGGIIEYTFRKAIDGEVTLDSMRFMPTYNFGLPETSNYLVIPLAEGYDYGLPDAEYLYQMIEERMTAYTDKVEVVEYLD